MKLAEELIRHPLVWTGLGLWIRNFDSPTAGGKRARVLGTIALTAGVWRAVHPDREPLPHPLPLFLGKRA